MRPIRGVVQRYAWGDDDAIPRLLGQEPDGRPWAEWWLGTHPGGPSVVEGGQPLLDVSGELPYLLKLLAARSALSLQTHPDPATAEAGFTREQAAGIAIDDARRIYRDPNAKPELLVALTPFDALCGFRPLGDTEALLHTIGAHELAGVLRTDGLEATVSAIYRSEVDTATIAANCIGRPLPQAQLVCELATNYPGDPSVIVTLFLNRVRLQPGEAIYLTPGNLHAYLQGMGVEVMGASDNVVRGGLTPKHIDVAELLRVLRFDTLSDPVVHATEIDPGRWSYPTPGAPFEVSRLELAGSRPHIAAGREIVLCTDGDVGPLHHGEAAYLAPGETAVFEGPSTVFVVSAP